jgi:hypothetical protein
MTNVVQDGISVERDRPDVVLTTDMIAAGQEVLWSVDREAESSADVVRWTFEAMMRARDVFPGEDRIAG